MIQKLLTESAIRHPRLIMLAVGVVTLVALAAFPSLTTDTDPVKMLPQDNPAVVLHNKVKDQFDIHDMVVIGINSRNGTSLFTPESLARVHDLTGEILAIEDAPQGQSWWRRALRSAQFLKDDGAAQAGGREIMVREDVWAPSTINDIVRNARGELELQPLMAEPPQTQAEADAILARINDNPIFRGKIAAEDGSLIGIFIPLQEGKKDRSYYLGERIKELADARLGGNEAYYLAGLPMAENTFGNEMFIQMGVYAPAAGVVIFLLLLFFFRSLRLVVAPMLLGVAVVIWAMGGLIYAGQTVHIMSSMIPIFLLPIAVLNSIHILSKLHDRINQFEHRADAIREVMSELFYPMLFTSLTTMVGFAALSTTGIPPVVVFGVTIAAGVFFSWLLSMTFIPAYTMLLSKASLKNFGQSEEDRKSTVMEAVQMFRGIATHAPHLVIAAAVGTLAISGYGLTKIVINDNPVRWFKESHVLRQADRVMNRKLAGTYMANIYFTLPQAEGERAAAEAEAAAGAGGGGAGDDPFAAFDEPEGEDPFAAFGEAEGETAYEPSIRDPEVIAYMAGVEEMLRTLTDEDGIRIVGGVTSIVDVLRKVGDVALDDASVPDTREKISQYMFLYESGDPDKGKDMWKFITPGDSRAAQMWLQMKTGDNQVMQRVMDALERFRAENPPPVLQTAGGEPVALELEWSGLTYINKVWQDEMVSGMRWALLSSFLIVFGMMVFLFRSVKWGFISMLPLTLTIVMIYGLIGFSGKYYDMPIAVLSSLTLGLSIDFAIHFIEHARMYIARYQYIGRVIVALYEGTAQAIWRNVLVVSIGFMPLFFAGLVPYITVGAFFFLIMLVSGITTLILLPAILRLFYPWLPGCRREYHPPEEHEEGSAGLSPQGAS